MESLGSTTEIVENKLILLYMLEKIDLTLSSLQIYKIVLKNSFMNYFVLQHTLDELAEKHFLNSEIIEGRRAYSISPSGSKTLGYFLEKIPAGIRKRIDDSVYSIKRQVRNETKITADYIPESENEYTVTLAIHEDSFPLIDIKFAAGTKNDAREICSNWLHNPQEIYSEIVNSLIKNRTSAAGDETDVANPEDNGSNINE
jgi:DNA-binding PadR family transcriptional regulator